MSRHFFVAWLGVVALAAPLRGDVLIAYGESWRYRLGTSEASSPSDAWRSNTFGGWTTWSQGQAPIGYGEPVIVTTIPDSSIGNWLSVFLRQQFTVANPAAVVRLDLEVQVDDGFIAWINGIEVARHNLSVQNPLYNSSAASAIEPVTVSYSIAVTPGMLVAGTNNVLAIQAFNAASTSSDLVIAAQLTSSVDVTPPRVAALIPPPGSRERTLTRLEVRFSEGVGGVEAADLRINGIPATNLVASGADNYRFLFAEPATGAVQVAWAPNHGVTDLSAYSNAFAGGAYTYILDPTARDELRISEFMAANASTLADEEGAFSDWIELHNAGTTTVNLEGWFLTDNPAWLAKWRFPATNLTSGGYLVVFASGQDRRAPGAPLHASFRLDAGGQYLALIRPDGVTIEHDFAPQYPPQFEDVSYGSEDRLQEALFFLTPTPGARNTNGSLGLVADTKFSVDRGFHDVPFTVAITTATAAAQIWCTVDGSPPAPTNTTAFRYTNAITISRTTTLRAAAFKTGWAPSGTDTHTYIFIDDVGRQSDMDPRVVASPFYAGSLRAIPTVSIVMNNADLFGSQGIYSNPYNEGIAWERAASVEFFDPSTGREFQVNAGLRIHGGDSRRHDKRGFGLFFRRDYGTPKLDFPLFDDSPVRRFDKIVLRGGGHDAWSVPHVAPDYSQATGATYIRDGFMRWTQAEMGHLAAHGRYVHLYLNGRYWGLYNPTERTDEDFTSEYLGGRAEDWDIIQGPDGASLLASGSLEAWNAMMALAGAGLAGASNYTAIQAYLDLDNFIDYMLLQLWGGNTDWLRSSIEPQTGERNKNWFAARRRDASGRFIFFVWDAEFTLGKDHRVNRRTNVNLTDVDIANSPGRLLQRLRQNAEFRLRFADRAQKHFFNDGALTPFVSLQRWQELMQWVERPLWAESARWGDVVNAAILFTPTNQWRSEVNWIQNVFLVHRGPIFLQQLRDISLFPTNPPPSLSQFGGVVEPGFGLTLASNSPGPIYFTLDGSDPRLSGGTLAPGAQLYGGQPIVISSNLTLRARTLSGNNWSALVDAVFSVREEDNVPVISEIMYNPRGAGGVNGDEFEFLEIKNAGLTPLDLSGWAFNTGIAFGFTNGTVLAPGQFFVLARNPAQFTNRYPGVAPNGVYGGKLANEGETLTLSDAFAHAVLEFSYDDNLPWPITPDGVGFSLVPVMPGPQDNPEHGRNWRASTDPGGSPGADDPPSLIAPIVINEVLSASDLPDLDYIELHNPTTNAVDAGGWFLTDVPNAPRKFRIADHSIIAAGGFLWFTEADFNQAALGTNAFALDARGDAVYLFSGDASTNLTGYSHGFAFGPAARGVAFGRHVNSLGDEQFPAQLARTPLAMNAGPRFGPVVINEIHYHPPTPEDEFVELKNTSGSPVPLYDPTRPTNGWQVSGLSFTFPAGVSLPANGLLLLTRGDPAAFRTRHGVPAAVPILQYLGQLQDSGENLELQQPGVPDTNGVPYFVVDAVRYNDRGGWPVAADGCGPSLQRLNGDAYGNDPVNWSAAVPTPGGPYPGGLAPRIMTPPQNGIALKNQEARFEVAAAGLEPLFYQWRYRGDLIPGATNTTLLLTNLQPSQAGNYSVVVFNSANATNSPAAKLTVQTPALILAQPTNQAVRLGSNATFAVTAVGSGTLRYQWQFNATDLAGATDSTFTVTNAQLAHEGAYRVLVRDAYSTMPSASAQLVLLVDPVIVQPPLTQTAVEGGSVTLSVAITGYPPPFGFIWRRGLIGLTNLALGGSNCFVTLSNLQTNESGLYRVIVTNAAKPTLSISASFNLTVLADSDHDGLPDVWEIAYGFRPNAPDAGSDADGDGRTNLDEYLAGTDPTNALSYLKVDRLGTGPTQLEFHAVSNTTYTVLYRDAIHTGPWLKLADLLARTSNRVEIVRDPNAATNRFYRVVTPRQP